MLSEKTNLLWRHDANIMFEEPLLISFPRHWIVDLVPWCASQQARSIEHLQSDLARRRRWRQVDRSIILAVQIRFTGKMDQRLQSGISKWFVSSVGAHENGKYLRWGLCDWVVLVLHIAVHMLPLGSERLFSSRADRSPRQEDEVQYHQEKEHMVSPRWPCDRLPGYWRHSRSARPSRGCQQESDSCQ